MFQEDIAIIRSYLDDLEEHMSKLQEKKVKSSGAKARGVLLKIKTLAHEMRKQVLLDVKEIPVKKSKKKVVISLPEEAPLISEGDRESKVEETKVEEPKTKKSRGRPKKQIPE